MCLQRENRVLYVLRTLVWFKFDSFEVHLVFPLANSLLLWSSLETPLEGVHSYSFFSLVILLFYLLYLKEKTNKPPLCPNVCLYSRMLGALWIGHLPSHQLFRVWTADKGNVGLNFRGLSSSAVAYRLQIPPGFANGKLDTICKNWNKAILVWSKGK